MQQLSSEQLVTATGGDLRAMTFGALAALNASGADGDPSSSLARAMGGRPPIVRIEPGASQGGDDGAWPFSSYGGTATGRFGY